MGTGNGYILDNMSILRGITNLRFIKNCVYIHMNDLKLLTRKCALVIDKIIGKNHKDVLFYR